MHVKYNYFLEVLCSVTIDDLNDGKMHLLNFAVSHVCHALNYLDPTCASAFVLWCKQEVEPSNARVSCSIIPKAQPL